MRQCEWLTVIRGENDTPIVMCRTHGLERVGTTGKCAVGLIEEATEKALAALERKETCATCKHFERYQGLTAGRCMANRWLHKTSESQHFDTVEEVQMHVLETQWCRVHDPIEPPAEGEIA